MAESKPNRTTKNLQLLKPFFEDGCGLCILSFLENVLFDIQLVELKLQRVSTTAVNLYGIITNLIKKLEQRMNDKYFRNKTHLTLNKLIDFDKNKAKELEESFELFIRSIIRYINSYFDQNQ